MVQNFSCSRDLQNSWSSSLCWVFKKKKKRGSLCWIYIRHMKQVVSFDYGLRTPGSCTGRWCRLADRPADSIDRVQTHGHVIGLLRRTWCYKIHTKSPSKTKRPRNTIRNPNTIEQRLFIPRPFKNFLSSPCFFFLKLQISYGLNISKNIKH